jgi:drug/metabolite transporter (DMT)-like permease
MFIHGFLINEIMSMSVIFDIAGAVGMILILLAYFLLQKGRLSDDDFLYNLANLVGAICIGIYSTYYKAWFSVILNVVWAVIALVDLMRNYKKK